MAPVEGEWKINILLFGPPGAGKGTQARRLNRRLGLPVVASGDLFRAIREQDTPFGHEVRSYMDRGGFVPDGVTIDLVLSRLQEKDAQAGFILDGFPRTEVQARALDEYLATRGEKVDVALHVTAPTAVLEMRLDGRLVCPVCGSIYNTQSKPPKIDSLCDREGALLQRRSDEQSEIIRHRLETHTRQTGPLIEYYRRHGSLVEIDGSRSENEVAQEVDCHMGLPSPR